MNELKPLALTPVEELAVTQAASGKTAKQISTALGIPVTSVTSLLAKDNIKELVNQMIEARNRALVAYLPNLLMEIIDDRVTKIQEDPDYTMSDLSKKDVVEIAKVIGDLTKGASSEGTKDTPMMQFYQHFNLGNQG